MSSGKGVLVVFSGPSGAGKGTVLAEYFKSNPQAVYSISATTRKPRPGERDGGDYHFVTREAFEEMIARDEVIDDTGTETGEEVRGRLETARREVAMAAEYDYIVVNDQVERAARCLGDIIRAAKCARKFNQGLIEEILADA